MSRGGRVWLQLEPAREPRPGALLATLAAAAHTHARARVALLLVAAPGRVGVRVGVGQPAAGAVRALLAAALPDTTLLDVGCPWPPPEVPAQTCWARVRASPPPGTPAWEAPGWAGSPAAGPPRAAVARWAPAAPVRSSPGALAVLAAAAAAGEAAAVRVELCLPAHRWASPLPGVLAGLLDALAEGLGGLLAGGQPARPAAGPGLRAGPARTAGAPRPVSRVGRPGAGPAEPAPGPLLRVHAVLAYAAREPTRARAGLAALAAAAGVSTGRVRAGALPAHAHPRGVLVGPAALAALAGPPGPDSDLACLGPRPARRLPPPAAPTRPLVALARSGGVDVGIDTEDLTSHAYVLGPSGTGKTTLLVRLVTEVVGRGTAAVVLDPHGDLVGQLLYSLPEAALARTALLDLADPARLPVVNPLWLPAAADPATAAVARAVRCAAVSAVFADLWGLDRASAPNLLHFLDAALAALIGDGEATLADLPRFLCDPAWRAQVVRRAGDPRVSRRWREFAALGRDDRSRTVRAILNKAAEFDRNPLLATVFGTPGPGVDLPGVMDQGRVLLVNLPRGLVPEGTVEVLGSLLVTLLHQAALARQGRPASSRPTCVAVIDEFQEFSLRAFAQVVTSTRKYGLGLVVANQNLSRVAAVSPDVLATLLANVATLVSFRPGAPDAAALAPQFAPLTAADLLATVARGCHFRVASGGGERTVVSALALPPLERLRGPAEVAALLPVLRARLPGVPLRLATTPPPPEWPAEAKAW